MLSAFSLSWHTFSQGDRNDNMKIFRSWICKIITCVRPLTVRTYVAQAAVCIYFVLCAAAAAALPACIGIPIIRSIGALVHWHIGILLPAPPPPPLSRASVLAPAT